MDSEITRSKRGNEIFSFFNEWADGYSKYRNRRKYYWNSISQYFNYFIKSSDSILQIGCGTGETLEALNGAHKTGVDISPNMISCAKGNYDKLEWINQDAHTLSIDKKYDVIILSNVIGYLENIQDVLSNLHSLSHDRTRILIHNYNKLWQPVTKLGELLGIKKRAPEQNWLSPADLSNLLYLSGFETYRSNRRMLIPFYIPLISTLFNKYLARLPIFNYFCLSQYVFARVAPEMTQIKRDYTVSVVVPARNESGNIKDALDRLPSMGISTEMIFIEGNSTDDTWETIQRLAEEYKDIRPIKIGRQDGKGKYDAVKKGYDMAEGDILMILDADLTVPPEELPKFYDALVGRKAEFINGSRLVYPMESEAMRFLNMLGNKFFSYVFSWLLEQPIKDTLCGTKVMMRKDYENLAQNRKYFGDFDPFGDFDLIFGSYKLNLKIIDLPIRYRDRQYGDTNISRFRHGMILIKMVLFALNKIKFI